MERAEIIPVEPDPDYAGVRERRDFSSVSGFPGTLFCWRIAMKLMVNGELHEYRGNGTPEALLEELGAKKEHTALLLNGEVLPSKDWKTTALNENDEIEMLVFVGGG
jgi:thiamine biosynthesis protein ThiS